MTIPRSLAILAGSLSVAVVAACAPAPIQRPIPMSPIESGTGTVTQARKFLEGRWSLVSFEIHSADGKVVPVSGAGILTYDDFGNLSIEIRVDQASFLVLESAGIPTDKGRLSSTGRTVLDLQAKKLTYVLEGKAVTGAASGPLAVNRPRYWEVDGDRLTLTTRDDAGKPTSVGIWQRAAK